MNPAAAATLKDIAQATANVLNQSDPSSVKLILEALKTAYVMGGADKVVEVIQREAA